jgi:hypothetical protein
MLAQLLQIPPVNWNKGLTALTSKKPENFEQIHADNLDSRSGVPVIKKKKFIHNTPSKPLMTSGS